MGSYTQPETSQYSVSFGSVVPTHECERTKGIERLRIGSRSCTYEAVLNEKTGELSILKGDKVVAKTATQLKTRDSKGRSTEVCRPPNA